MLLRKLERFPHLKRVLFVVHEEFKCIVPESPVAEWPYRLQLNFHDLSKHNDDANSRITWHFHRNELQYYPLQTEDMEQDDIDMIAAMSDGEEDDAVELNRKPTNDDWRRFKRRFVKAHGVIQRHETIEEEHDSSVEVAPVKAASGDDRVRNSLDLNGAETTIRLTLF
ncbi:hypothetical protein NW762_000809 [Fusarium torreyae]|uniref:Uncharacterized protein n=1 Tax=Fusarium torreyae TaxID=1237075 RepID=A0A9W8SH39_9HYPO|nr:hypothetical protein NW762_000809 [Fusarium torreyae]